MKLFCKKSWDLVAASLLLACALCASAQDSPSPRGSQTTPPQPPQKETRISPEETKELFRSLNVILSFASDDTKLPIRHEVKRRLISRDQVEKYILEKFHDDKDAKRMQREEIVLAEQINHIPREFAAAVDIRGAWRDALASDIPHRVADHGLLVVEADVHRLMLPSHRVSR